MPTNKRGVERSRRVLFDIAVDRPGDGREVLAQRETRAQRRLDVRHEQRRADAFARDVADEQRDLAVGDLKVIEEVAADFARRHRDALDFRQAESKRRVRQHLG